MRKLLAALLVGVVAFVACGGDDDGSEPQDVEQTLDADETEDSGETEEYVAIQGGEEIPVVESCVDTSGQYTGNLPEGGLFILRGGTAPDESFVDFLPSQDADPLSSKEPGDTTVSSEGSFVTGTTIVYTEDGANSLELEFGIVIEDTETDC